MANRRSSSITLLLAAAATWFALAPPAHARVLLDDVAGEVLGKVKNAAKNTDNANALLRPLVEKVGAGPLGFLDDVNVELKWFNADNTDENPGLGVAYRFAKQIQDWNLGSETCGTVCTRLGADLDFHASGNVAFDQSKNPDDFLDTKLAFEMFGSHGGPKSETPEWRHAYSQLGIELAKAQTQEEVDVINRKIEDHIAGALADQYFADVAAELGYETNQDFSARQLVYGGRLGTDVKGWSDLNAKSYGETHLLSKINILDYPFAAIRYLTRSDDCAPGVSRCFVPRGTRLPLVSVGIALVDPAEDDERRAAGGNLDPFPRFDGEASFKTPVLRMKGTEILFTASYRYYREIGADRSVKDAGLDEFDYLALTLGPASGPFIRYGRGQLPFDQREQNEIELGIKADFDTIKQFLVDRMPRG